MKNLLTILFVVLMAGFASNNATAQCGSTYNKPDAGLFPLMDSLPCIQRSMWQQFVINFKNYDSTVLAGATIHIDSVRIDTIANLPCGYKWVSDKARNTFMKGDTGCIRFWGSTTDPIGEYSLDIAVTAFIHEIGATGVPRHASDLGLRYDVRVIDAGTNCPAIDTTQPLQHASCGSGLPATVQMYNGVSEMSTVVSELNNYPNPFNGTTEVVFTALQEKPMTFRVSNILGETVHSENFTSAAGRNIISFNGNNLEAGVYFYSLNDGVKTITNRMVITK